MAVKNCWVTVAVDETTAKEAVVLAKSLSRTITKADTVVLIPLDFPESMGKMLTEYFTAVVTIEVNSGAFPLKDYLQIYSWNLDMYNKCILVESKTMVLKNCDEIFRLQCENMQILGNNMVNKRDATTFLIKPHAPNYRTILKLATSGKFNNLTEVLNEHVNSSKHENFMEYPGIYHLNTTNISSHVGLLVDAKIVTFSAKNFLTEEDSKTVEMGNVEKLQKMWKEINHPARMELSSKTVPVESLGTEIVAEPQVKTRVYSSDAIAVVGHSCRFPASNNVDEFWELLINAGDGITACPVERLADSQRGDPKFTESKGGYLKCPIDEFDAKFFGISPREAAFMDPQQRLLVEVAWEALENAAIDPQSLKGSNTGVFSGVWTHDYQRLINESTTPQDFHHIVLGNAFSATSARVSFFLGLNGPNVATESGCSSSMVGLHLACESLKRHETDINLVLGAHIMINQISLQEIPILAKDGHCKTFDEKADGFGRAEGVAVVVLKRLSDAIKNNDRIMGIIRGTAMSSEGTSSNFGTPSKLCQEIAVKEAIRIAGIKPGEVDYVEAHGTGTPVGDPIEFSALSAGYKGEREKPLMIGSVKTNTGHTESASGLAGLIKVMLAMKHEIIPPHRNFDNLNPNINLDLLPAEITLESRVWPRNDERVRIAGISSFGISGTNVHAILEEPPTDSYLETCKFSLMNSESDRSHHILALSAKSENALKDLSEKYVQYFEQNPNVNIADVAFTANTGKAHLKYRHFVVGENISDWKSNLQSIEHTPPSINAPRPKVGFLFTGQGSQYFEMAKGLYQSNVVFQDSFNKSASLVQNNIANISLADALWNESHKNLLDETIYSQLSIFCVEYSLVKLWESLGVKPDFVLGHSVGEFAAATAAGILSLEEAIHLLSVRSKLINKLPHGGMLAVRCSQETISQYFVEFLGKNSKGWLDIAVVNSPDDVVVAGDKETLLLFKEFCLQKGKVCQMLAASHAFHSRAMEGAMNDFGDFASSIEYKSPKCCYISGTTGEILNSPMNGPYWQSHARETVNFSKGIKTLANTDCNVFIEIGAHPVLLALGMNNVSNSNNYLWVPSIRKNESNWTTFLESCGHLYSNNLNLKWEALDKSFARKKLELPSYPFQRQKYWMEGANEGLSKIIHPMLGKKLLLANVNDIVYENIWNIKNFQYLHDHQVANITVLPGAGFLEIILAAGKDIFSLEQKNASQVLKVDDFVIESPLELRDDMKYKIQVVASPIKNEDNTTVKFHVRIYLYKTLNGYNDEKGWKQYSSAFIYLSDEISETMSEQNNFKKSEKRSDSKYNFESLENIKARCPTIGDSIEFYKLAPQIGIYFGETFQSIESVWEGNQEALAKIPLPSSKAGNLSTYVYHPIVLDAMIQILGLSIGKENADLFLPVGVNNFSLFKDDKELLSTTKHFYAHATWEEPGKPLGTVALYNDQNVLLGVMSGVRLLQTSVSSFLNVINAGNNMLPGLYQEVWRIRDGPLQCRANLANLPNVGEIIPIMHTHMNSQIPEDMIFHHLEGLAVESLSLEIIKGFANSGWNPVAGELCNAESMMQSVLIAYKFSNFVERLLEIFCQVGFVKEIYSENSDSGKQYKFIRSFPPVDEITKRQVELSNFINSSYKSGLHVMYDISRRAAKNVVSILQGKIMAVEALFNSKEINPLEVYTKAAESLNANIIMGEFLKITLNELKTGRTQEGSIIRILEIGSGSGASSAEILKRLRMEGIQFRYTFTDISPNFLENAKSGILSSFSGVDYELLDIEKDPSSQGFCPGHYDVIVASNVIHATENLNRSIQNVRKLLAPRGLFVMQEMLKPVVMVDMIFGVLDGFWKFNDYDLRRSYPLVSKKIWDKVFLNNGLESSVRLPSEDKSEYTSVLVTRANNECSSMKIFVIDEMVEKSPAWIIFSENGVISENLRKELLNCNSNVITIVHDSTESNKRVENHFYINLADFASVSSTLDVILTQCNIKGVIYLNSLTQCTNKNELYLQTLNVCKYFVAAIKSQVTFCLVTRGALWSPNQENGSPSITPVVGMIKSFANEAPHTQIKLVDLDPDVIDEELDSKEIFFELFSGKECTASFRNRKKFVNRLVTLPRPMAPLTLPLGRYVIEIPKSRKIDDVAFKAVSGDDSMKPDYMEVLVKATALNFRDIFVILKPESYQTAFEAVGTDFGGIVTKVGPDVSNYKVGDEVFGIANVSCAASHLVGDPVMVIKKPKHYTFAEASTLPSVFFTAWHCLVDVAHLKSDDTILIHVASGGVGLVAIQIAKHIGAKIIATAGSHRKRSYLKSIGVEYVFHSRDLTFEKNIHEVTCGRGVDVVLNSLTGPGFVESSLKICAQQARFVEMAKVNIWSHENIRNLRPDVNYTIVDLEKLDRDGLIYLLGKMEECIDQNIISPLPHSRFEIAQTRDALNYFLKSQHIGKVVLSMPEMQEKNGIQFYKELLFNSNGTYLITGGLGGIGLEVAKWMVDSGVKNLILVGRSLPNTNATKVIQNLKNQGCRVMCMQCDVGCKVQCQKLFDVVCKSSDIKLPPLRGVIHSAGVLWDAMYSNQTWESYESVFNSKVNGGWNLHEMTKDLKLEHFVLFSSMASMFCAIGQSNYAAANMYLDSLAHYRHSIGLPAQTINWGAWSEVGAATNTAFGKEGAFGIKPFTPSQGIAGLKFLMTRPNLLQLGIIQLDISEFKETMPLNPGLMIPLVIENTETETTQAQSTAQAEQFLKEISTKSYEERVIYVKSILEAIVRKTLKLPSTEPIDEYQKFSELGLDSLMAVEMKNKLQNLIGKSITLNASSMLDYPSIHELSKYLAQETMSIETITSACEKSDELSENTTDSNEIDENKVLELVIKDSLLPADIQITNTKKCVDKKEIRNILLTGSTGQVGVHILKDLLENPTIEKVYCLVRGKDVKHAQKKLNSTLKKYRLNVNLEKVSVIVGNIAGNCLGLEQSEYDSLSDKIDCVFHFAAKVNHVENYYVTKSNIDVRSVNVLGTINVIRFCANIKIKHLVHASTYTVINRLTSDGLAYEEFPDPNNFGDGIVEGYIVSKFVGEKLVKECCDRGIPTTAIRYPAIVGNSVSGHFTIETNFLMNVALSSSRVGVFPDIKGAWNCLPVDIASKLTMELVFSENAQLGMFNLFHTTPMYSKDIVESANDTGYNLKLVSEDEYFETLEKDVESNSFFSMYTEVFGSDFRTGLSKTSTTLAESLTTGVNIFSYSDKFLNVIPNVQDKIPSTQYLLRLFFDYAKTAGISSKFGITFS